MIKKSIKLVRRTSRTKKLFIDPTVIVHTKFVHEQKCNEFICIKIFQERSRVREKNILFL